MRAEKAYAVEEIGRLMDASSSLILTSFTGLDSSKMNALRKAVEERSGHYFVVKNRMFGIAARQRGLDDLCSLLKGQVGIVFGEDDSPGLLKAVVNFGKENEQLRILGGFFDGGVRCAEEMLGIAAMPPRGIAAGQLVGTLASPLSEVLQVLGEVMRSLVFVVTSISEKKASPVSEQEG